MADTTKVSVTMPKSTREWLRSRYPDSTSDSQAVLMAIKDARDLETIMESNNTVVIQSDS
jgi:hypothetical protein